MKCTTVTIPFGCSSKHTMDTRTSLFRSIELYEKYTLKATRSSRKSVHNKQLWKWAKAKLTEKAVGRFKQHHSIGFLFRPKDPNVKVSPFTLAIITCVSFSVGATCSCLAGFVGLWISVRTNVRVASAARNKNY